MPVSVIAALGELDDLLGPEALAKAQDAVSNRFAEHMDPFVPKDTGTLADSYVVDGEDITYTEEYAAYPYGMDDQGTNWSTTGTGSEWDAKAAGTHMDDLERFAADLLTGGAL